MTTTTAPVGTGHGQQRWYVAREHLRPTRFGEPAIAGVVWAVRPITGRGRTRRIIGGPSYFTSRTKALAFAHRQARLTYGTPRNRKATP